jgi:peroxiredoxin
MKPGTTHRQRLLRVWRSWAGEIALLIAIVIGFHLWNTRTAISGPAPALSGRGVDGRMLSLASLHGSPVVVYFWATWCGVCRAEESNIASLAGHVPVLTVSSSSGTAGDVAHVLAKRGVSLPTLVDPEGAIAETWGVRAFPTAFFVGADGRIRQVETGYVSTLGLRARVWWASL